MRRWHDQSQKALSALLCFGGGILMATVFLHLLPDILGDTDEAIESGYFNVKGYPLGEILLCSGFFVMYTLEEVVHFWVHRQQEDSTASGHHHVHAHHGHNQHLHSSHTANGDVHSDMQKNLKGKKPGALESVELVKNGSVCKNQKQRCESTPSVAVLVGCDNPVVCTDVLDNCTHNTLNKTPADVANITVNHQKGENHHDSQEQDHLKQISALRTIMMVIALSIHGCLEGLALGLAEDSADVWIMFSALTVHKIAISFSVSMELLEKEVRIKYHIFYMVIFSIASPIGASIGAILLEYSDSSTKAGSLTIIFLNSLSGGTIMFVVFCEILERERSKSYGRFTRLLALIVGFFMMASLELLNHEHDEPDAPDVSLNGTVKAFPMLIANSLHN